MLSIITCIYYAASLNVSSAISLTMQSPKHVIQLLTGPSSTLHQLVDRCSQLQRLTRLVRDFLPAPLNQHCQAANIRDQQLVMHTDSSTWATLLHYQSSELLHFLRQQPGLEYISNIRTRICPRPQETPAIDAMDSSSSNLSGSTATLIGNLADSMSNPALKKALQRLAAKRPSGDSSVE